MTFGQLTRLLFKCVRVASGKICFQRKGCLGEQDLQRETQAAGLSLLTLGGLNTQSVLALWQLWVPFPKNLTNKGTAVPGSSTSVKLPLPHKTAEGFRVLFPLRELLASSRCYRQFLLPGTWKVPGFALYIPVRSESPSVTRSSRTLLFSCEITEFWKLKDCWEEKKPRNALISGDKNQGPREADCPRLMLVCFSPESNYLYRELWDRLPRQKYDRSILACGWQFISFTRELEIWLVPYLMPKNQCHAWCA